MKKPREFPTPSGGGFISSHEEIETRQNAHAKPKWGRRNPRASCSKWRKSISAENRSSRCGVSFSRLFFGDGSILETKKTKRTDGQTKKVTFDLWSHFDGSSYFESGILILSVNLLFSAVAFYLWSHFFSEVHFHLWNYLDSLKWFFRFALLFFISEVAFYH